MNPQELLRTIALYVSNGMPADEADRFVAQESGFQYNSVKELSDFLGAQRHAQNVADNPRGPLDHARGVLGGLAQNAIQGLTLSFGDEMAGGMNKLLQQLPQGAESYPGENKYNRDNAYAIGKRNAQRIGDDLMRSGPNVLGAPLGTHVGASAQTIGGLLPMLATGVLGAPPGMQAAKAVYGSEVPGMAQQAASTGAPGLAAVQPKFWPELGKAVGLGGLWGSVAGSGAAPTMADVPSSAAMGGALGAGIGGLFGLVIPAADALYTRGRDVAKILQNDPKAMRALADREVGSIMSREAANGNGLPVLDKMAGNQLTGVIPADAGPVAASKVRVSTNTVPDLRLPAKQIVRTRTEQRANDLASALERGRGITQTEGRAGAAEAAAAKRAVGNLYDDIDPLPIPEDAPVAGVIQRIRSWATPEVPVEAPAASMSPMELLVARQNFKMGVGPNPDIVPPQPPPRPYGAPQVGRAVDRAMRKTGERPLTVQHARAVINTLKTLRKKALGGPSEDKTLAPVLKQQIDELEAALEASSPEVRALNAKYRAQSVAEEAYQAARGVDGKPGARNVRDPIQALADRNAAIKAGPPETRMRMAQGSTADWTDMLRNSNPRRPGGPVNEFMAVANPRNKTARRTIWNSDFPGAKGRDQVDEAAAMAERMGMTENDMIGNSTSMAQASDIGTDVSFQLVRDAARGGTPKWSLARMAGDLLDNMRIPGRQQMARNVFDDLTQSYTPEVRERLWGLMQLEAERKARAGLLGSMRSDRAAATGGLLSQYFTQ